ncbi:hypothetical protein C8J57DRAFT_1119966 [Mycena rebaudengoi]|nr:hypothetical protein C8J57DRAFT_1119966 [Mycena rebaudengoi]
MTQTRPPLPVRHANENIKLLKGVLPPVKYQILNCQGSDILVGRLKLDTPTPSGHTFILRRYDTGAVSLTTMFRAAFPNAPDDAEKREVQWVKDTYDLNGNNGSSKDPSITRLAGTWVSPAIAVELGQAYALGEIIQTVVDAQPDPAANYRRSGNKKEAAAATPISSASVQAASRTLPTPSPKHASPNPAKRRKESSPAPAPALAAPVTPLPPRRSTRTKSPAPKSTPIQSLTSAAKAVKKVARREEVVTPGGSDETAVDEEGEGVEESMGTELHEQDLAEQKDMIEKLKSQRDKALAVKHGGKAESAKAKRAREDEEKTLEFEFKEPEIGDRVIATNSRISPSQKSFVWGVMAFTFGAAAVSFLPSLF